jgi:hypothetical protein
MFSHIMIGSNDMARSKKFYDALFIAMGGQPATEEPRGRLAYSHNGGRFMVTKPIDGSEATHANGGTIGFQMKDAAQAEAWHNAGVANGGTSIEDIARIDGGGRDEGDPAGLSGCRLLAYPLRQGAGLSKTPARQQQPDLPPIARWRQLV